MVPRRPRPPASRMTRGPPRSAPCRIQVVLSARSKSQGRQPNSSSPSPATCRESCGLGAATPRRYDLTSAGRAFQASFSAPRAAFGARPRALRLGLGRLRPPRPAPPTPARPPTRTAAQSEDGRPVLSRVSTRDLLRHPYELVPQTLNDKHFFFISANALRAPSYDLSRHTR